MSSNEFENEKKKMTPETGFNLVGIDYFENPGNQHLLAEVTLKPYAVPFYGEFFSTEK